MIRFYNGKTLRFEGGAHLTADEVWVEGDVIVRVGPAQADAPAFEREIDLDGDVLLPGFKDAHTHTAMVFLRSLADDMPLDKWLSEQVWPNEARLTPEAVYDLTRLGILEYLSSGITASFDMYVKNDAYAQANIDSGFRTVICSGLNNFDADVENIEREYLKFNALHPLVSYRLGIHAEYTTCMERREYLVSLAEKYRAPCFTHLCETKAEVDGCVERYGLTPPQLLDRIGFFRYGGGGFHCNYMSDEDIALFASKSVEKALGRDQPGFESEACQRRGAHLRARARRGGAGHRHRRGRQQQRSGHVPRDVSGLGAAKARHRRRGGLSGGGCAGNGLCGRRPRHGSCRL